MCKRDLLIAEAQQRNSEAFSQLQKELNLYPRLYGYLGREFSSLSVEDIEDICQEALLKIWNALPDLKGRKSFISWCFTISHRTGLEWLKSPKRCKPLTQICPLDKVDEDALAGYIVNPSEDLEKQDLFRFLDGLTGTDAQKKGFAVLVLNEVEGLPYEEITRLLDAEKPSTVRCWKHRFCEHAREHEHLFREAGFRK